MACSGSPVDVLKPSAEKTNYIRLARLLMCGGTTIFREVFDSIIPPLQLPTKLNEPAVLTRLNGMRNRKILTFPQWKVLFPSPGTYGKSESFDITLLFKLLREFCGLPAPLKGWDDLPDDKDHSLSDDLARIKYFRNEFCHVMDLGINDGDFNTYGKRIKDALLRIVQTLPSLGPSKDWEKEIDRLLTGPITDDDERNIEELESWYLQDIDIKDMLNKIMKQLESMQPKKESQNNCDASSKDLEICFGDKSIATIDSNEAASKVADFLKLDKTSLEDPPDDIVVKCRELCSYLKSKGREDIVKQIRYRLPSGMTGPLGDGSILIKNMDFNSKQRISRALSEKEEWKVFADNVGVSREDIAYYDQRVVNPVLIILDEHCGDQTVEELYVRIVESGANAIADNYLDLMVDNTTPSEILARGPKAQVAYQMALKSGKTKNLRVPVMPVGQSCAGKTSLLRSLKPIDTNEAASKVADFLNLDKLSLDDPPDDIVVKCRELCSYLKSNRREDIVKQIRVLLPSGMTGPLGDGNLLVKDMDYRTKQQISWALVAAGDQWKVFAENVGVSKDKIRFYDKRVVNPVLSILDDHCGNMTREELYVHIVESGANATADNHQ